MMAQVFQAFRDDVLTVQEQFRKGIIHGDLNDCNVMVSEDGNCVSGVIDFGDVIYSSYVYDLSIAIAYAMLVSGKLTTESRVINKKIVNVLT